jgi:hypothetical protein
MFYCLVALQDAMDIIMGLAEPYDMENMLLPDNDPLIVSMHAAARLKHSMQGEPTLGSSLKKLKTSSWPGEHAEFLRKQASKGIYTFSNNHRP